jgi:hypothetical protein
MKTIIDVISITSKTVLFTLMFSLLPINSHDINKRSAVIHFHLTKGKEEKQFVKCANPKIVSPQTVSCFTCVAVPAMVANIIVL